MLNLFRFALIPAIFLLTPALSFSQGVSDDPRLIKIISAINASAKDAESKEKTRTAKYVADLKALEKKVQQTGDLDLVLQITKERKAWEEGKPTPAMDFKDNSFNLDLRKLRYYFDQDIGKLKAADMLQSDERKSAFGKQLDELVRKMTTEGKIAEALEVRKLKSQYMAGTLSLPDPEPVAATEAPPAKPSQIFPLKHPDKLPPLPKETCRLVILEREHVEIKEPFKWLEEIEKDDHVDFVKLSQGDDGFGGIREGGTAVLWTPKQGKIAPEETGIFSLISPTRWLRQDGTIGFPVSTSDKSRQELAGLSDIVYARMSQNVMFLIDARGNRHLVGGRKDHPNLKAASSHIDTAHEIGFAGLNYLIILDQDGSVRKYTNEKMIREYPDTKAIKIIGPPTFLSAQGKLIWENGIRINKRFLKINQSYLFGSAEDEPIDEVYIKALKHAVDLSISKQYISVLIPAEKISRSGLWKVEDLAKAMDTH